MAELEILIGERSAFGPRMNHVIDLVDKGLNEGPVTVTLGRPKRRSDQNRHFHALIGEIARQVKPGGQSFGTEVWKAMLVDQFEQEMETAGTPLSKPGRTVPSLDGRRAVTVRPSTTELKAREAKDFIEFLYSWGIEHDVKFSPPAKDIYEQYREASQ